MSGDITRDPVFGEVARALQVRALGVLQQRFLGNDVPLVEFALRTSAIRDDTFESVGEWHEPPLPRDAHVHERDPMAGGTTRVSILQTVLEWDSMFLPNAEILYQAHENRVRAAAPLRFMGVVNVTPDSFSDGGRFLDPGHAIEHGLQLVAEGADLLDVGGESTRPGSQPVGAGEELCRIKPVIEGLARTTKVPISVDTTKSAVARAALDAGAAIVNDVSAGRHDPAMLALVASRGAGYVAMHMQGEPRTMQAEPCYDDVVTEVTEFLRERCAVALEAGVDRAKLWIDPGIGFGKSLEHNLALLRHLSELRSLGLPILVGASRKAFIGRITGRDSPAAERIGGTAAAVALAVLNGAEILRVHDVAVMREAALVARAIGQAR